MKFSKDFGIAITEDIKKIIQIASEKAGNAFALSKITNIPQPTISMWMGKGQRKGEFIVWDSWKPLRDYLVSAQIIEENDPQWMLPSEMRQKLEENKRLELADDERQALELFRILNENGRQLALQSLRNLASNEATSVFKEVEELKQA